MTVTNGLVPGADAHRSAQAVEAILATLARALPAVAASSASLLREQQVLVRLARQFGLAEDSLRTRLKTLRRALKSTNRVARSSGESVIDAPPAAERVSAWDREIIEFILLCPETLPTLAEHVQPEDVESLAARELYQLAMDLHHNGATAGFEQLMSYAETEAAKTLLVDCDERGRSKGEWDRRQGLRDLLAGVERRRQEPRHQEMMADFSQRRLDEASELETLRNLYHDLSRRQTGPAPTDG